MKVTVCFNSIRVVVPCGEGEFKVRDLIAKAIVRYKKATGKSSDSWVTVHNLRQSDGGILDPDDCLLDVADDREQIIAIYEEATKPQQGDGTSASDESENPSPDIFKNVDPKFDPFSRNDIEITGEVLSGTPPPLHVRRGSEPALNRLSPIPSFASVPPDPSKRWSAAPIINDHEPPSSSTPVKDKSSRVLATVLAFEGYPGERGEGSGEEKKTTSSASSSASSHHSATTTTLSRFSRDGNRCSVQILSDNPNMARWAEAADRLMQPGGVQPPPPPPPPPHPGTIEGMRREPLGGSATPQHSRDPSIEDRSRPGSRADRMNYFNILVSLLNDGSPLGIHVIPSTDRSGHDQGLLVEGIESDGRVARDGRIQLHDVIIEINGKTLKNVTFHKAQEIFKDAMMDPELQLLVVKRREPTRAFTPVHISRGSSHEERGVNIGDPKMPHGKKIPPTSISSRTQSVMLQSNTRRLGRRLVVNLVKGPHGLGFSITTRDNPAGVEAPIYIKNILPKGAAIDDGNLRIGDRLLEVNGIEVTGYSQSDVAGLLRQIPVGGVTSLTVSRQEKVNEFRAAINDRQGMEEKENSPKLPRQMVLNYSSERSTEDSLMFPWKQREILTFEIPVHDSERAGLGVSVKGKTSSGPSGSVDLGIFVKNVIHGGAASRDGRLKQNDQLVNINGLSLLGKPNSEAMRTLRTAMHQEGPSPGMITLTVARRLDNSRDFSGSRSGRESVNSLGTCSSGVEIFPVTRGSGFTTPTPEHSGTSDTSDCTVIFNGRKEMTMELGYEFGNGHLDPLSPNNPVIQRITGSNSNNPGLRNESYYKATHDTWNHSQFQQSMTPAGKERMPIDNPQIYDGRGGFGSPTVNLPPRDTLIIHDEYDIHPGAPRFYSSNQGGVPGQTTQRHPTDPLGQANDAYVSQSSLEESSGGFSRDQFGRQSMSEKRHATLDAKSTDTYQRSKKAREEREKRGKDNMGDSNEKQHGGRSSKEVGPALGMKKSSSLESLQTMVQEMALEEEGQRVGAGGKVPRGRGCNESFRAAVDRSYEAPLSQLASQMETLAEEESESSGSGFGRGNSRQSSVNSVEERMRKAKKKQSLLKGLGSMFRFGKHRKSLDGPIGSRPEESSKHEANARRSLEVQKRLHPESQDGNQDPFCNRMDTDKSIAPPGGECPTKQDMTYSPDDELNPSRSERMHQLRAEHQRRHVQRNKTYPTDKMEEQYDQAITKRLEPVPPEPKAEIRHIRSQSFDFYGDGYNRPGSRGPFSDPNKFSHYVNYEQIQMHLRNNEEQERLAKLASRQYQDFREKQTSREQREYQSQRCSRESSHQQRPISNYFEYESVQAIISNSHEGGTSTSSLPRRGPHQPSGHSGNRNATLGPPHPSNLTSLHHVQPNSLSSHPSHHIQNQTSNLLSVKGPSQHGQGSTGGRMKSRPSQQQKSFQPSRNTNPPPMQIGGVREGVYAASGFRPASHYSSHHPLAHHSLAHSHNTRPTTLTVPGSKV